MDNDNSKKINDFIEKVKKNANSVTMEEAKEIFSLPEVQERFKNSDFSNNYEISRLVNEAMNNKNSLFDSHYNNKNSLFNLTDITEIRGSILSQINELPLAQQEEYLTMIKDAAEKELEYLPENRKEELQQNINEKIVDRITKIREQLGKSDSSNNKPKL